jgi:hypothetical protein
MKTEEMYGVLVFPVWQNMVFLGTAQNGICVDHLNGWGGHIEDGETPLDAAFREFGEETEREAGGQFDPIFFKKNDLFHVGSVRFLNTFCSQDKIIVFYVYVFLLVDWRGTLYSSSAIKNPEAYKIEELNLRDSLMPGDYVWMKPMLSGEEGVAEVDRIFESDGRVIATRSVFQNVSELPSCHESPVLK